MTQHVNLALDDAVRFSVDHLDRTSHSAKVALGYAELHPRQDDFIRVTDRGRQL